jgi:hypothetical protein
LLFQCDDTPGCLGRAGGDHGSMDRES